MLINHRALQNDGTCSPSLEKGAHARCVRPHQAQWLTIAFDKLAGKSGLGRFADNHSILSQ